VYIIRLIMKHPKLHVPSQHSNPLHWFRPDITRNMLLIPRLFPSHLGVGQLGPQLTRSPTSFTHTPAVLTSHSIVFNHFFFGLPLSFLPSTLNSITVHTAIESSLIKTLLQVYFPSFYPQSTLLLCFRLHTHFLFSLVTQLIYLSILISDTLILYPIFLFTTQHSEPYNIVG